MRSCNGSARTDRCGVNFCKYCTIPRNVCISFLLSGCFIFTIALIFFGSSFLPWVVQFSPKNVTSCFLYWSFSKLSFTLFCWAVCSNFVSARSWSLWSSLYPTTMISSVMHITFLSFSRFHPTCTGRHLLLHSHQMTFWWTCIIQTQCWM